MSAEGAWHLRFTDMALREETHLGNSRKRVKTHGQGAISDWILKVTDKDGFVTSHYMDQDVQVQTLPKYGNLYVELSDAETEHLDKDHNGELDRGEGEDYLNHYVREYHQMDPPTKKLILDRFMADYQLHNAVRIQEAEGLQRYLSQCYGPVTDTYNLLRMDGQNQNILRSTCRNQFEVGNRLSTNMDGAVARKNHVVRHQRQVRYIPVEGYRGEDYFTYKVRFGNMMSTMRGRVDVDVRQCRGYDECESDDFAHHDNQRHSRN
jgi:hypothetical protein